MLKPELLQHPNIPKPLHGLAPRVIKGQAWWDQTRKSVYHRQDYKCLACGTPKSEAWPNRWLECHEHYRIDYSARTMEITEMVALCPACHKFIHSGLLQVMMARGEMTTACTMRILSHGFKILNDNRLAPSFATYHLIAAGYLPTVPEFRGADYLGMHKFKPGDDWDAGSFGWDGWRLLFDGEEYPSLWKTQADWAAHYGR